MIHYEQLGVTLLYHDTWQHKLFKILFVNRFFNTVLHWLSFLTIHYWLDFNQASSNLLSFSIAVTFSFFMNARYTFKTQATWRRYLLFVSFMGLLSFTTGYFSEK
ncbi:GtrA family protein [Vreelandella jeotgali]|uniref:GtrA family protein n=1 Tax=Vreelandella jeotgali TaxID=553386 RepID=UPI000A02B2F9